MPAFNWINPRKKIFYGWWIVSAGFMAQAMMNGLFFTGFSFFFEPMRLHFGWSRTLMSGAYLFSRVESGLFGPVEGFLIQRYGAKRVMIISFVVFALGFISLSKVYSPLTFYIAFFVLSGGASTAGFNPVMVTLNNWFRKKRARAISTTMLGMSIGSIAFSPLLAKSIENFGWEMTALGAGFFVALVGIPISFVMRDNPEPYGYLPDGQHKNYSARTQNGGTPKPGESNSQNNEQVEYDFTLKEALKTRAFWMLAAGHAVGLMVVSTISLFLVPYTQDNLGYSLSKASSLLMIMTAVSMVGQISAGFLANIFPKHLLATCCLVGHASALFLLGIADSYTEVVAAVVVQGVAWGVRSPLTTVLRGDYFGRKYFAAITGISSIVLMIGLIVGPILTAFLTDNYGYQSAFIIMGFCALPGVVLFAALRNPQPKSYKPTD